MSKYVDAIIGHAIGRLRNNDINAKLGVDKKIIRY